MLTLRTPWPFRYPAAAYKSLLQPWSFFAGGTTKAMQKREPWHLPRLSFSVPVILDFFLGQSRRMPITLLRPARWRRR